MIGKTNAVSAGASPAETVIIRLEANGLYQSVVYAASVTLMYGDISDVFTWQGSEIAVEVPAGMECSVTFGEVEGYRTPSEIRFVSITGNTRQITGLYESCLLTVNVSADQGSVSGYEVLVEEFVSIGTGGKYNRLEYVESDGSQCIDTGYAPNSSSRVVMDFQPISGTLTVLFGNKDSGSSFDLFVSNTNLYYAYGNDMQQTTNPIPGQRTVVDADGNTLSYGNASVQASKQEFSSGNTIYLLTSNFSDGSYDSTWTSARIYSCRIYDNGTLVRDYIPAMDKDGVAGLYDAANDVFQPSTTGYPFRAGTVAREVLYRQTSAVASYNIPYGKRLRISASDVAGFITPPPVTFDAGTETRTESFVYVRGSLNVWIATEAGNLVNPSHWDYTVSETPVGVAVITGNSSFILTEECFDGVAWCSRYPTTQLPGVPVPSEDDLDNGIYYHYDGMAYTDAMYAYSSETTVDSSNLAKNGYKISFGGRTIPGYIGSTGEWADVGNNYVQIEDALERIGKKFRPSNKYNVDAFWTSCQKDNDQAYAMTYYPNAGGSLDWWFAYPEKSSTDDRFALKPFYKI